MELLALSFIIITALTIIVFYLAVGRDKRILGALALWTAVVGWSAYGGFFENTSTIPPRILLLLLPLVVLMIVLYRQIVIARTNLLLLTAVHIVRISVELILYGLYLREKIPVGMTYAGWNFDIVVGISAIPLLIYWFWKSPNPTLLRGWNYFGLAMLSIIIVTAILFNSWSAAADGLRTAQRRYSDVSLHPASRRGGTPGSAVAPAFAQEDWIPKRNGTYCGRSASLKNHRMAAKAVFWLVPRTGYQRSSHTAISCCNACAAWAAFVPKSPPSPA